MDTISIAIIVTVLSLGSALVYLFKLDFERRQKPNQQSSGSNNGTASKKTHKSQSAKVQAIKSVVSNTKQVPLEDTTNLNLTSSPTQMITVSNSITTKQVISKSNGHNPNKTGSSIKLYDKQSFVSSKAIKKKEHKPMSKIKVDHGSHEKTNGLEPSIDELDSSVSLGVFNPGKNKLDVRASEKSLYTQSQPVTEKKSSRKRQNSGNLTYSSEQLFNIIAASNLSKDETELAIETLLNKIESGESDWKQPKSDPIQKLKNQLRDNEVVFLAEVQNHELTRKRLTEVKSQLHNEESKTNLVKDELNLLRKEFGVVNSSLEQTHGELAKQQLLYKQLKDESSQLIAKLEQDKAQLQSVLSNSNSVKDGEFSKLRNEIEEKTGHLKRFELSNQAMAEKIQELEAKLRSSELQLDQVRSNKQHDDYEACAKITELESDQMRTEKSLKDHVARLKEVSETNDLLEKSVKELQLINSRQEEMLKRLRDERHVNEASLKRTLCEMQQELKELQVKLSASSATHDEKHRKEMNQVERELSDADQREQKLVSEMKELREGLAALLPDLNKKDIKVRGDDWVRHYLAAVGHLAKTVDELRDRNNNNESPSKKTVDKSTTTVRTNGASSRVGSPISNGRVSKAGSHQDHDGDKKMMETKLLELNSYVAKLEEGIQKLEEGKKGNSNNSNEHIGCEQQVKDLKLQRNKLEAQIKFGLDSLKMEQERVRDLEEELAKYKGVGAQT